MECNGEKVLNLKHLVTLIEEGEKVRGETKYELYQAHAGTSALSDVPDRCRCAISVHRVSVCLSRINGAEGARTERDTHIYTCI